MGLAAVGVLAVGSTGTLSGWTGAQLQNSGDSTPTGSLAFQHAYQTTSCSGGPSATASVSCAGSIAPTAPSSAGGAVTGVDTITNLGSVTASRLTQQVSAPSCGPVQLANTKNSVNPLLARYGTTFHASGGPMGGAGYVTLSGASPGGYGSAVVQQTQPVGPGTGLSVTTTYTYGLGVWFNTSSAGPLFEVGSSPSNTGATDDRILWIDSSGKLHLIYDQAGDTVPQTTGTNYADGGWHFAYVTLANTVTAALGVVVSASNTESIYVGSATTSAVQVGTLTQSVVLTTGASKFNATSGYWHLGWAPTGKTGLSTAYFTGSLSNLVVWDNQNAPAAPMSTNLSSQSVFATWVASGAAPTDWWPLNDSGTATFTGALPSSMTAPCGQVNVALAFASPTDSIAMQTLAAFANGSARTVAAPGPGVSQTMTTSLTRGTGYSSDIAGLHLYAPLTITETTNPTSTSWRLTFTWSDATSVFIA